MSLKRFVVCDKCQEVLPFLDADYYDTQDNHSHVVFLAKDNSYGVDVDLCPRCCTRLLVSMRDSGTISLKEAMIKFLEDIGDSMVAYALIELDKSEEE